MKVRRQFASFALLVVASVVPTLSAQKIVDRVVARVEDEIILQSDIDELARYQTLVDGQPESQEQILDRLIDQWIVRKEAEASRFPTASEADIERGMQRLQRTLGRQEDLAAQREKAGLNESELRQIVASQAYLSNYLDSRFRPSVQVDEMAIQDFYTQTLVPRAKARGQQPPPFDTSRDLIQEILTQRGINEQADKWLKESRTRLSITKFLNEGGK